MYSYTFGEVLQYLFIVFMLIVIIGAMFCGIYLTCQQYSNEQTIEIVVKDKYIKRQGKSDRYLIVSEDNDTYKITDLAFIGKYNSSDIYNQLEVGKKYKITTTGNRMPYWSEYPNINKIEEVKDEY